MAGRAEPDVGLSVLVFVKYRIEGRHVPGISLYFSAMKYDTC